MRQLRWTHYLGAAGLISAGCVVAGAASAYTAPYSTPAGITLVDVSKIMDEAIPQFLWRRLGDADGKPLYTYDADQGGKSSCYAECAQEFPPFLADERAKAAGDFSILTRADHVRQWVYQGQPLYRYSGKDPEGEPVGARFQLAENPAWHDPSSRTYSPKHGWRRAAFMPEKSILMPPSIDLDGLAVANGFGFVDAATRSTLYAAPPSQKLPSAWEPVRASALALPVGDFSIIKRKDDGARQWTYKGQALYTYSGDYAVGEINGIFAGERNVQAALAYRNFLPEGLVIGQYSGRGPLMTTSQGMTIYTEARYVLQYGGRETRTGYAVSYNDAKSQGAVGCQADCTVTWKPFLAAANAQAWGFWEPIDRGDGSKQWAYKGSPIYTFTGDKKPGEIEGNNRHVIVYGGPQGQIVYSNPGTDPRGPKPRLGKLDMVAAAGPPRHYGDDDTPLPEPRAAADAKPNASAAAAPAAKKPGAGGGMGRDRREGAGFYWHIAGLFY
jgi:predicted lipoprotein with Yx(FWY)xxD motif